MKKLFLVAICGPYVLFAQPQRQTIYSAAPDCYVQELASLPAGGSLLAGYARYASDSSLINLVFLNDSDEIVSHKEFNTATRFDIASCLIPAGNGFLLGGKSSDTAFFHPQLIRTDGSGNVQWAKYFDNLGVWHGQVIRIVPDGNGFSMYTYAETPVSDLYRIDMDAAGTSFTGKKYLPSTTLSFRIFDVSPIPGSSSHILGGHGNFNSSSTRGGLLMKTTPSGVSWCKHFTAGGTFKNDIVDVITTTGGISYSVFVCENMPGNQYSTIVLKSDSSGNMVWARQLSIAGGTLNGCSVVEAASNELVVATYDNLYVAYLTKLDASGNLVWTKQWTPSTTSEAQALKLFRDASGRIVFTGMLDRNYFIVRLDAGGNGCNFTNSTGIASNTVTPVLTNISFTTAGFIPALASEPVVYSGINFSENILCGSVGMEEPVLPESLLIYPNPVTRILQLRTGQFRQDEATEVSVLNLVGEKVLTGKLPSSGLNGIAELDVSSLRPGIYFLRVANGDGIFVERFCKH